MKSKKRVQYASLMYNVFPFMIIGDSAMILTYIFIPSIGISLIFIVLFNIVVFGIILAYRNIFFAFYHLDSSCIETLVFGYVKRKLSWNDIEDFITIFKYGSTYISFKHRIKDEPDFEINLTNKRYRDLIRFCSNPDIKMKLIKLDFSVFKRVKYDKHR